MKKRTIDRLLADQAYNLAAGFLYAAGICYFARGASFAPGGISGLALIANHLFRSPIGLTSLLLNLPLIALSFRFLGRTFLAKTVVSMLWCTLFQDLVFARLPAYGGEPMLAAVFTGILWGAGLALFYMRGSSSGGTDFLTMSIKTVRPHLSVGVITGSIDAAVILLGWAIYGAVDAVLYGLITTMVTSLVIDRLMYGQSACKMLMIVTDHGQAVADAISVRCARGATLVQGTGAYTGSAKQVVWCACSRPEVYTIRTAAYEIDAHCMVMVSDSGEVYGEGFRDPQKTV